MATRNISVTTEQNAFIAKSIANGHYQNASELMRDALRALQMRQAEDKLKLKRLREAIQEGIDASDRGDYIELQPHEVRGWVKSLGKRHKLASRAKRKRVA